MIKFNDISKSFDGKEVIKGLTFDFPESGFISLCGASGYGKTTVLNLIAGLINPDSGSIEIGKSAVVSMSFQEPRLLPGRTATQNVNIVLGDKKATLSQAKELLMELGIPDFDALPDELSGGMKARVGIARALAYDADVYLFDEPFASLDSATAQLAVEVIKKHTGGKLVLAVMHDESFAELISDRVIRFTETPIRSAK
ncbi:MAG: ATP-binding cassette domain-containing protein [Eubacteriales bacterium]